MAQSLRVVAAKEFEPRASHSQSNNTPTGSPLLWPIPYTFEGCNWQLFCTTHAWVHIPHLKIFPTKNLHFNPFTRRAGNSSNLVAAQPCFPASARLSRLAWPHCVCVPEANYPGAKGKCAKPYWKLMQHKGVLHPVYASGMWGEGVCVGK